MAERQTAHERLCQAVIHTLDTQIRPFLLLHGGGVDFLEVTAAGQVRLEFVGACRGCALKSATYAVGVRQKLLPVPGVTEVTMRDVRVSDAALRRAVRFYSSASPWLGAPGPT